MPPLLLEGLEHEGGGDGAVDLAIQEQRALRRAQGVAEGARSVRAAGRVGMVAGGDGVWRAVDVSVVAV